MITCTHLSLLGSDDTSLLVRGVRCKSWNCEICAELNKDRLIAIAIAGMPTTLMTLTTNPHHEPDPERAADELLAAWQRFARQHRQQHGSESWSYLAIWEATQRGMPHLHVLLRAPYIEQAAISQYMQTAIEAPIVDIRAVTNTVAVARYVAKYVGKAPAKFGNHNRFMRSHNWLDTPAQAAYAEEHPTTNRWTLSHLELNQLLRHMSRWFDIDYDGRIYRLYEHTSSAPDGVDIRAGSP